MKDNEENKMGAKQELTTSESPAELIKAAVTGGADLEKLKGLLDLQERWDASQARKAYHAAMTEFKKNPPKITKDKTVKYKDVRYSHASLWNIVETITKALSEHGLSASWQTAQDDKIMVTCKITHVLGHSEETTLSAPSDTSGSKNAIQAIGSTITYLERYTLMAALGLSTFSHEDTDGAIQDDPITEEQAFTIREYIAASSANEEKLLKWVGVESVEEIPQSAYEKTVNLLKRKVPNNDNN